MKMTIRPMLPSERKYTYAQSQQIMGQTGSIGRLRGDFGSGGEEFFTSWDDHSERLKTQEFKEELDAVINALRSDEQYGGILASRGKMSAYCHKNPESGFDGSYTREYGFRVDTENHSYLFRLNPSKGDYNLYCFCYRRDWLDSHIQNAAKGIRFIDPHYKEKFRLADGDKVRIIGKDGENRDRTARYIDDYHVELSSGSVSNLFHICEFAERLEASGGTIIPLRSSLPEQCYSILDSTGEVIILQKGVDGYSTTDIPATDRISARQIVDHYNEKLGVTKAQEAAMKAGSMFGWDVPAADPKSYNEDGYPLPVKGNRYDALSQSYDSMEIFDQPVMFFCGRIDRSTVPDGMFMYEIRHSDEDWGEPIQLGKSILINHYGTIISSKPIDIPPDGLREISAEDWGFTDEGITNLAEYAKKYPPTGEPPNKARKNDAR